MVWGLMLVSQGWGCHCWCSCLLLVFHRIIFVVLLTGIEKNERSESGVTDGSKMSLLVQNDSIFVTIGSKRFSFVLFATRNGPFVCFELTFDRDAKVELSCLGPQFESKSPSLHFSFFGIWDLGFDRSGSFLR